MAQTRQTEELDRLYFCNECGKSFLFRSDKEDHIQSKGHTRYVVFTVEGKLLNASEHPEK